MTAGLLLWKHEYAGDQTRPQMDQFNFQTTLDNHYGSSQGNFKSLY